MPLQRQPLTREQLEESYRASLRREVQLRRVNQHLNDTLLHMQGKLLQDIQMLDTALQDMRRIEQRDAVNNDVHHPTPPL